MTENKEEKLRSELQHRALHLFFQLLAEEMNTAGVDLKLMLKDLPAEIQATKENVKADIWKPIMWAMFQKKSTKELNTKEIDQIYDEINKHFGSKGLEIPRFPSVEELIVYEKGRDFN